MTQAPSDHRQIGGLEETRDGVVLLGAQALAADEEDHEHGDHGDRENGGERNRERFCVSERPEHPTFLGLEQEHRKERDDYNNQREKNRTTDLLGGRQQDSSPFIFGYRLAFQRCIVLRLRQVPISVLDHHDRSVDEHAYRQGQSAERHDVGAELQIIHRNERRDDRDRQRENGDQRRTQVKEKDDDHEADDDSLFEQIAFQCIDRFLNESRAIVAGDDFDASRQSLLDLSKLFLDPFDDGERVLSVAHHDDAADGLSVAVPLSRAFAQVWSQADHAEVSYQHWCTVVGCDRNIFEIRYRRDVAESADQVVGSRHLEHASADFAVAVADFVDHRFQRDFER